MIKTKDLLNSINSCYGCRCNTYEGQDVYSVSLCSVVDGTDCVKTVYSPYSTLKLKTVFCKSCWEEMAGNNYTFDEVETQATTLYGGIRGNGAGIQGTWHHAVAPATVYPTPLGPISPPFNPLGNTLPSPSNLTSAHEFDKTDALICASLASMALVIGFVIFKVGCFIASFI